jgi:tetratricopeptide (TPR) repeat protein
MAGGLRVAFLSLTFLSSAVYAQRPSISDAEALQAGHYIDSVTSSGSPAALIHFIDLDSLLGLVRQQLPDLNDPEFMRGFRKGFLETGGTFGGQLASTAAMGSYHLLREYAKDGCRHLLFREWGKNGLNYHDYALIKVRDSIKASDVFVYTVDENISTTIATMSASVAGVDIARLSETDRSLLKLSELRSQKAYAAAKQVYDQLDRHVQDSKAVQVIYIGICHHLSDSLYHQALEHFAVAFPDAPSVYLMMIDVYYVKKDYDKGLAAVNKLDSLLGKDAFLDLYRGNFYKKMGKKDEALNCYQRLYLNDPTVSINTRTLIIAYAQANRYDDAKKVIGEYKQTSGFQETDLDKIYSAFPALK